MHKQEESNQTHLELQLGKTFIRTVKRWSWAVFGACTLYQFVFFPEITNIVMIGAVALAWLIMTKIFLQQETLRSYALSSLVVIGFTGTQFYFPLVFTTLEGKSLVYNLELPETVFLHSLAGLLVLILAHKIYRLFNKLSFRRSFSILEMAGLYTPPTDSQLWLMGAIGMGATVYVYFTNPDIGWEVTGAAGGKFLQGLIPFTYAPFFIPFGKLYGRTQPASKTQTPKLIAYTLILFVLAIGRNSTGTFVLGFTAIAFSYFLGLLLGMFETRIISRRNIAIALVGTWVLLGPLADLRTAMVLVRGERLNISANELIPLTIDTYLDKEAIRAQRKIDISEVIESDWDEHYLDNDYTARFANLKFNDASLLMAEVVDKYDPDMLTYSVDYMLGLLPNPFVRALKLDIDKDFIYSLSIGDYLYMTAGGYGEIASFRTGHFAGTGMATFGWWYLFILGIIIVPIFFLFDKFAKKKVVQEDGLQRTSLQFSFCGILAITSIFLFLSNESVIIIINFLIRGYLQLILLYSCLFHVTRVFTGNYFKRLRFGNR